MNGAELKNLVARRQQLNRLHSQISQFLIAKGICKSLVTKMMEELLTKKSQDKKAILLQLITLLSRKLLTIPGFVFKRSGTSVITLVGPTGIGKSTTLIKLKEHLERVGKRSLIATHEEESTFADYDVVLIDTPGCNYYESGKIEKLGCHLAKFKESEIHLTVSAAAKEVDLYGAIHQFSPLGLKSLIFTKLDETLAPGVLVNVSTKVDLPISYIAYGYPLPGIIEEADGERIAHKILTDFNDEQFHLLRTIYLNQN